MTTPCDYCDDTGWVETAVGTTDTGKDFCPYCNVNGVREVMYIKIDEYVPPRGRKVVTSFECSVQQFNIWDNAVKKNYEFSCEYRAVAGKWVLYIQKPGETEELLYICDSIPHEIVKRCSDV